MLTLLLHALLSSFTNLLLNLIFVFLHALFSPFANQLLNIVFILLFALLFFFRLVSTSKFLNLDYCSLHVLEKIGGEENVNSCKHTHTPGRQQVLQKNNGEDLSCRPLSTPVNVNVEWSLSAPVDVNVERSPRHIMSVSTS